MGCNKNTLACVEKVKKLKQEHPNATNKRIAALIDNQVSPATVSRILQGHYDDIIAQSYGYEDTDLAFISSKHTTSNRVTADMVIRVKDLKNRHPSLSAEEISEITEWASATTIRSILNGIYDKLLQDNQSKQTNNVSYSVLTEEIRTFREQWLKDTGTRHNEIMDVLTANNQLLADIATMLVNHCETDSHLPSKACESHFRDAIKKNRRKHNEDIRA